KMLVKVTAGRFGSIDRTAITPPRPSSPTSAVTTTSVRHFRMTCLPGPDRSFSGSDPAADNSLLNCRLEVGIRWKCRRPNEGTGPRPQEINGRLIPLAYPTDFWLRRRQARKAATEETPRSASAKEPGSGISWGEAPPVTETASRKRPPKLPRGSSEEKERVV